MRRLVNLVAACTASLAVPAALASRLQVPASTVKRYLNLLDLLFITRRTPAWSTSLTTRAVATPELVLTDSGLAAHLTGNARGGRGAAEHLIGALRCMYGYLVADGILTQAENPAARARKPPRLRSARMALPDSRLGELCRVAASTGNDPALDALLLRLHMETACRRGGALALTPHDLDAEQCLIRLHEKGETVRWQPVSPTLMSHLLAHGESRGGLGNGQRLMRHANGRPITKKRYEVLWRRLGEHLAWVETLQVSMYWIRHIPY